jgi:hypothetical protein
MGIGWSTDDSFALEQSLDNSEMTVVCVLGFLGSFGRTLKARCAHFASKEATEHARNLELAAGVMSKSRDVVWERGDYSVD